MDEDDFKFELINWIVEMTDGNLVINDAQYEENEDDPTYDLVREIAFLRGLFK
jgi:hypothetical protein